MAWVRIDDHGPEHPKLVKAGTAACWLWVCGLAYCARHLTDGRLPREAVSRFGVDQSMRHAERLVAVGLWEVCDEGFIVHDYLNYNPSSRQVLAKRRKSAERVEHWKRTRGNIGSNAVPNAVTNAVTNAVGYAVVCPAPVPVPDPVPQKSKNKNMRDTSRDVSGFDSFWNAYPKKRAKCDALKAWLSAKLDDATQARILTAVAVQRASHDWTREDGQYIPYPASWLRGKRWEDESGPVVLTPTSRPMPKGDPQPAGYTRNCDVCREPFEPPRFDDGTVRHVYTCPGCANAEAQAMSA